MIKRLFFAVFGLLIGISLIRATSGEDYLSFRDFLYMLSNFDVGFYEVQSAFNSISTLASGINGVGDVLDLIGKVLTVPFAVIVDLAVLVYNFGTFILVDVLALF